MITMFLGIYFIIKKYIYIGTSIFKHKIKYYRYEIHNKYSTHYIILYNAYL